MNKIFIIAFAVLILLMACSCSALKGQSWLISYSKVEYFFSSIDIKIGTDSCYYLNQGGINKNPPVFKWKSTCRKLNKLYKQIEKYKLQDCSPLMATVTEEPFETLELIKNGKVIFSLQKHHQTTADVKKFEDVVALLKSFSFSENDGWKY